MVHVLRSSQVEGLNDVVHFLQSVITDSVLRMSNWNLLLLVVVVVVVVLLLLLVVVVVVVVVVAVVVVVVVL